MTTYWTDMTSAEFDTVNPETWVALLPVAAIEQHGPHLPVSVDADINRGVVDAAMHTLPTDAPIVILPMLPIGKSNEHQGFRGTLALSAQTLISLWTEVAESVARAGFRKIVFLNSHGGQPQVMDIVARDLRVRLGMFAVTAQTWSFGLPDGLFSDDEVHFGIHAGEIETSMMMTLRPEMVRHERLENFKSAAEDVERDYAFLKSEGSVGFGWMTQDLNPLGAAGNALKADSERGRLSIEHAGKGLAKLLQEVSSYPLAALKPWPSEEISV